MPVNDYKPNSRSPVAVDKVRCKAEVHYYIGNWPHYKQCENKAKPDGYCGTHNPEKVKAREEAVHKRGEERFRKEVYASCYGRYGRVMAEALAKIRDGDNDPRTTARLALEAVQWEKYGMPPDGKDS